jgi:hypothetical protein
MHAYIHTKAGVSGIVEAEKMTLEKTIKYVLTIHTSLLECISPHGIPVSKSKFQAKPIAPPPTEWGA